MFNIIIININKSKSNSSYYILTNYYYKFVLYALYELSQVSFLIPE